VARAVIERPYEIREEARQVGEERRAAPGARGDGGGGGVESASACATRRVESAVSARTLASASRSTS
jgi:hypothetical protein